MIPAQAVAGEKPTPPRQQATDAEMLYGQDLSEVVSVFKRGFFLMFHALSMARTYICAGQLAPSLTASGPGVSLL
jgi:hypothetical protein